MKKLFLLTTIMVFFFYSCAKNTTTELTAEQKATIEKELRDQFDKLMTSINQLNFDPWSDNISKTDFISAITRKGLTSGYSAWADSIKVSFLARERHTYDEKAVKITALTPTLALLTQEGIWENWWKNGDYSKTNGLATFIWKKEQDGWKIIHSHESGNRVVENPSSGPK